MSNSEAPEDVISGTVVQRTSDGKEYELQPDVAGQLQLQPVDGDHTDAPVQMSCGQFLMSMKGGTYYIPDDHANVSDVLDAVREYRDQQP